MLLKINNRPTRLREAQGAASPSVSCAACIALLPPNCSPPVTFRKEIDREPSLLPGRQRRARSTPRLGRPAPWMGPQVSPNPTPPRVRQGAPRVSLGPLGGRNSRFFRTAVNSNPKAYSSLSLLFSEGWSREKLPTPHPPRTQPRGVPRTRRKSHPRANRCFVIDATAHHNTSFIMLSPSSADCFEPRLDPAQDPCPRGLAQGNNPL